MCHIKINKNKHMKTKHFFKAIIAIGVLAFTTFGCEPKEDPVIEELDVNRVFAPTGLTGFIRNVTSIELNWNIRNDAERYIVEFSQDSLEFNSIIRTVEVVAEDLPLLEEFAGNTRYSARVKGVAEGKQDSKWATITLLTNPEQLFSTVDACDIQATSVTLRWTENSDVTNFIINPGNINRPITPTEQAAGEAIITGLSGETAYTILLYNNNDVRGTAEFTTLTDEGTLVETTDNLSAFIAAAADGDILLLAPGTHNLVTGALTIDKSITIRGLSACDKPTLNVSFTMSPGLQNLELKDLELDGTGINAMIEMSNAGNYNSVLISGCDIHDYGRQLIYSNASGAILSNFLVDNSIITNFTSGGGDFIDFRNGDVHNVEVTNSTFVDAPNGRDFIRMDAAGSTNGTGVTATVLVDKCTFVGVSNTEDRIVYVRFNTNDITVTNNLFADTNAKYSNQTSTDEEITFGFNNYFNAPNFFDSGQTRYDTSSNFTTFDPGFVDAANGDYTVTNQSLIDNGIGDPRWLD